MEEYPYLADAMDAAIANLGAVTSWAEEMECFSGFRTLTVLGESTDLRGLITEEGSTFLHDLGAALDGFERSTLLGGQIKGIVSGFLDDEALTGDVGMVRDALDRMKANLESGESFVWADEFSALAELLPVLLELPDELTRESAEDIGSALDRALACGGRLLDKSVLDAAMKSALDEVAEGVTEIEISGVVESLKALVEGAERLQYESELTALYDLFDEVQKLDTTDLSSLDFASLGECLDQFGPDGERTSVLAGGIRGVGSTRVVRGYRRSPDRLRRGGCTARKDIPSCTAGLFCLLRLLVQSGKHRRLARGHALTGTALSSAARRAGLTSPVRTRRNCRTAAIAALKVITSHKEILAIESQ